MNAYGLRVGIYENLSLIHSDEGLTLETSALKLFAMANLRYQPSW